MVHALTYAILLQLTLGNENYFFEHLLPEINTHILIMDTPYIYFRFCTVNVIISSALEAFSYHIFNYSTVPLSLHHHMITCSFKTYRFQE